MARTPIPAPSQASGFTPIEVTPVIDAGFQPIEVTPINQFIAPAEPAVQAEKEA